MLENIDLDKQLSKDDAAQYIKKLEEDLTLLQRECKKYELPIVFVFEGWGASGKGTLINHLISSLDPRGFQVYTTDPATKEEKRHPYLWRFFIKLPAKGRMAIFDRSWYRRVLTDRLDDVTPKEQIPEAFSEILNFERLITDDGMILIKFFLHISKGEQKRRFDRLSEDADTSYRVTKADWYHHEKYYDYLKIQNEMLQKTDTDFGPWNIIEATDERYAAVKIMTITVERLQEAIASAKDKEQKKQAERGAKDISAPVDDILDKMQETGVLDGVDLNISYDKEIYKKRLKRLQERMASMQSQVYLKKIPVIICFEGWDAAGKGGAIKRLTKFLDPRGYEVIPISAPNDSELAHHYLWRFYTRFPSPGHIAIFDRTWYGRVLVERIEGFCTKEEYQRAYKEINQMEEHLINEDYVLVKFWLHIDKEEQLKRFEARQADEKKRWKITEEDWRNREKWDEYEKAVDEMIVRTSTMHAPWTIVEANSKYFARIKVLQCVVDAIEDKLNERKRKEEKRERNK